MNIDTAEDYRNFLDGVLLTEASYLDLYTMLSMSIFEDPCITAKEKTSCHKHLEKLKDILEKYSQ